MRLLNRIFPSNKRAEEASVNEQVRKVAEEAGEFLAAATSGAGDPLEEAIDTMIAIDGWLDKQPESDVIAAVANVLSKGDRRGDWDHSCVPIAIPNVWGFADYYCMCGNKLLEVANGLDEQTPDSCDRCGARLVWHE